MLSVHCIGPSIEVLGSYLEQAYLHMRRNSSKSRFGIAEMVITARVGRVQMTEGLCVCVCVFSGRGVCVFFLLVDFANWHNEWVVGMRPSNDMFLFLCTCVVDVVVVFPFFVFVTVVVVVFSVITLS